LKPKLRFEITLAETSVGESFVIWWRGSHVAIPALSDLEYTLKRNAASICRRSISMEHDQ
jgi:hypothetical protein